MKIGSNYNLQTDQNIKQIGGKRQTGGAGVVEDLSRKDMLVSYYPQDPYVGKPVITTINGNGVTAGPDSEHIDTNGNVKPNADGNLIFEPADPAFINAQVFACIEKSIETSEKYLGRKVKFYGGRSKITVNPDKGEMRNAYYSRQDCSLNFFHFKDKKTGQIIYTGKSAEIVNHEGRHAKIDGVHPGWMGWNPETGAVHEACADCGAMIDALHDDNNLEMFLQQTGGDFKKANIIANMGEEFGMSAYGRPYLRNAINNFTYTPPESLPEIPPSPDQLGGEAHYFAPLFVGAFYDILGAIFHSYESQGMSQKDALLKTREIGGKLLDKGIDVAPPSNATYKDLALAMIKVDQMGERGKHVDLLTDIFKERKILTDDDLPKLTAFDNTRAYTFLNSSSPSSIIDFVDKNREVLGINQDVPLSLQEVNKNEDGSERFNVGFNVEVPLNGSEYGMFDGAVIDIEGGVNLGTKETGLLASVAPGIVSDSDISKTKEYMKKLIKGGRIKFVDPSRRAAMKDEDFFDKDGKPYLGYTSYEDGKMKIVRSPIMV